MNSIKLTNILVSALVLLLAIHVALETFRPIGRYTWHKDALAELCVLDTATGTMYGFQSDFQTGTKVDIVRFAKNVNDIAAFTISKKKAKTLSSETDHE